MNSIKLYLLLALAGSAAALHAAQPSAVRSIHAGATPAIELRIETTPQTAACSIEEQLPPGMLPASISHGGAYDAIQHKVKWGPFIGGFPASVTYRLTARAALAGQLSGVMSLDGALSVPVTGDAELSTAIRPLDAWLIDTFGESVFQRPESQSAHDWDGDGIPLIAEFFFALDPLAEDSIPFIIERTPDSDGIALAFSRRQQPGDIAPRIRASSNLADWEELPLGAPDFIVENGADTETVRYSFPADQQRRFFLLEVAIPAQ